MRLQNQIEINTNHSQKQIHDTVAMYEHGQLLILEAIATGKPLPFILSEIVLFIESLQPGLLCSILLASSDKKNIFKGAAPSLPEEYNRALDGLEIGPTIGSCGAAIHSGKRVFTQDIQTDPIWNECRHLALKHGLRSCWSSPIFSTTGDILGTFAIYKRHPSVPTSTELDWVEKATYLASIAIERQRDLERIRVSEERYRIITESVSDGIFAVTDKYEIIFVNQSLCKMFGYEAQDLVGTNLLDLLPSIKNNHLALVENASKSSSYDDFVRNRVETSGRDRTGQSFPVEIAFGVYKVNQRGYFSGVIRDITVRKKAEESLLHAKQKLEIVSQAKNSFIANMSHEVRTPLSVILGYASLMAKNSLSNEIRSSYLEIINRNGNSLRQIIDSVLDMAKLESGEMTLEYQKLPVKSLINDVVSSFKEMAERKGLALNAYINESTPTEFITDQQRARQILMNIVGNAMKFTDKGQVSLNVYPAHDTQGNLLIVFDVIDTGPGINQKDIDSLFQKFSQVDGSLSRKYSGTGLGLVLAREFARKLGGEVEVIETSPGKGSTFRITLMKEPNKGENWIPPPESHQRDETSNSEIRNISNLKILLVEDSQELQELFSIFLHQLNLNVTVANNGRECLDLVCRNSYDLIFMDLQMPILNGYDATRALRESGFEKPIIALSAHAMAEERSKAIDVGCSDHLCKPVDKQTLWQTICRHIST